MAKAAVGGMPVKKMAKHVTAIKKGLLGAHAASGAKKPMTMAQHQAVKPC